MRPSLQQACVPVTVAVYSRSHRLGYRPVQNLQGCKFFVNCFNVSAKDLIKNGLETGSGAILGGGWQCKRIASTLGYVWWPWKGSPLCVRSLRCGALMFFHYEPGVITELSSHVVSRDSSILSGNACNFGRMQERLAVHVPRWNLFIVLRWSQPICQVTIIQQFCQNELLINFASFQGDQEEWFGNARWGSSSGQRAGYCLLWNQRIHVLWCERSVWECHSGSVDSTSSSTFLDDQSEASATTSVAGIFLRIIIFLSFNRISRSYFRLHSDHQNHHHLMWQLSLAHMLKTCDRCWTHSSTPIWCLS